MKVALALFGLVMSSGEGFLQTSGQLSAISFQLGAFNSKLRADGCFRLFFESMVEVALSGLTGRFAIAVFFVYLMFFVVNVFQSPQRTRSYTTEDQPNSNGIWQ